MSQKDRCAPDQADRCLRLPPWVKCDNEGLAMPDMRTSRPLTPALLLALSGCSLLPVPAKPHRTTHVLPRPHSSASSIPSGPAAVGPAPPQGQSLPDAAAAEPSPVPMQLVGLSQSEVRQLLGPPTTSSTKGAAQSWTYQRADCSIEIAFYYDLTRNGFFALSQRLAHGADEGVCLSNIHDNHVS
jgi:hypothetical protein